MASNRKKQDEKHLKILRNLVSLPGNKQCFDCNQRGPTYVNVTIGSFVCTTCSGFLRGLTPPHRVKSISMATFTPEEIDSLQSKGNENQLTMQMTPEYDQYCRKVWLALFDSNNVQNAKDEHLVRDFMVAKYEKKLYYVEPCGALKNGNSPLPGTGVENSKVQLPVSNSSLITSPSTISSKLTNLKTVQPQPSVITSNTSNFNFSDPFEPVRNHTSRPKVQQAPQQVLQEQSFANFDNNPIFNSPNLTSTSFFPSSKPDLPSEDKYAALKELDCLMKMPQESSQSEAIQVNGWSSGSIDKSHSLNPFQTDIGNNNIVNPFRSGLIQQIEKNANNNSNYGCGNSNSSFSNGTSSNNLSTNNTINPWGTASSSPWANNVLTTSQSMPFPGPTWNGTGNISIIPGNSNNPFL